MATTLLEEPGSAPAAAILQPRRPWLTLYGLRVRPKAAQAEEQQAVELAPIQRLLPEELVLHTFGMLPAYTLGKVACVCRQWRALAGHSALWEPACREAFAAEEPGKLLRLLRQQYQGSWRSLFLQRPHLRFAGLYVARNTYIRTGLTEWRTRNPVHLVCYFRYLRFLPDGRLLYRTSPEVVSKVAKSMRGLPGSGRADESLLWGRWQLIGERLVTAMRYPNVASTEIRSRLRLRSTVPGAHNRLDCESIVSFDRFDGSSVSMTDLPADGEEGADAAAGALSHRRGLAPYVFIPDEAVATHILNQTDVSKMDYYLPG